MQIHYTITGRENKKRSSIFLLLMLDFLLHFALFYCSLITSVDYWYWLCCNTLYPTRGRRSNIVKVTFFINNPTLSKPFKGAIRGLVNALGKFVDGATRSSLTCLGFSPKWSTHAKVYPINAITLCSLPQLVFVFVILNKEESGIRMSN